MEWKATKLYSVVHLKCPVCHEGEFFQAHPYNLNRVGDLHERCPVCGVKFEKEVGFFTGALYVSYAIGVAVSVSTWVAILVLIPQMGIISQIVSIAFVMLFGAPLFYALSKIVWVNLFFHYDPTKRRSHGLPTAVRD